MGAEKQVATAPARRRRTPGTDLRSVKLSLADMLLGTGAIEVERAAHALTLSKRQLAETVGLAPEALQKSARRQAPKVQSRLREMLEIINLVQGWAGSTAQALAWYRAEPIPAFGGRTAEALVKSGQAAAVRDYVDHVTTGGYA